MYRALLLFTCYEYEHRQKSLGNEVYHFQTTSAVRTEHPLNYSTGGGRQLFVFVTLETAIHIFVLGDNLQFNIMEYVQYYSIVNARVASCASYSAHLDMKRANSRASYIADPDK